MFSTRRHWSRSNLSRRLPGFPTIAQAHWGGADGNSALPSSLKAARDKPVPRLPFSFSRFAGFPFIGQIHQMQNDVHDGIFTDACIQHGIVKMAAGPGNAEIALDKLGPV